MSLKELRSNLKTVPFGKDQPGGGDSGLPYIKTGLPENSTALERIVLESARFSSDYPTRGGFYAVRAVAEDAIRIRKFLTDFPKGSNFTSKQVGLQKSNPLMETGKNGGRINTRTYNLNSNLLLSVLTAGSGVHYPRSGATPLTLLDDDVKYASIVGKKTTDENRLVNLYKSKIIKVETNSSILENLGISSDEFQIMNYIGGPDSTYGDGETIIFRATDHRGLIIDTNRAPGPNSFSRFIPQLSLITLGSNKYILNGDISSHIKKYFTNQDESNRIIGLFEQSGSIRNEISSIDREQNTFKTSFNTVPYDKIIKKEQLSNSENGYFPFTDFRAEIEPSGSVFSRNYSDDMIPMTTRIGIGSPGSRPRDKRTNTNIIHSEGQDKVNMTPIYYGDFDKETIEKDPGSRDLIKFAFETIDNDNPTNTYRTHFRAFLKGFSDSNTADWNDKRYAGRGENMYTYQGFNRNISFNFTVFAQSKQEMKPLWQKLNYLNSTLMPNYSEGNGFMRGNITRLTIGEYLYRTPGVIKSLNFTVNDQYPWEIKMDEPEGGKDNDMMELPHGIDVSVTFSPILHTLPRTITKGNFNIPSLISENIGDTENFIRDKNPFQNL
jgi:hypothetical protein